MPTVRIGAERPDGNRTARGDGPCDRACTMAGDVEGDGDRAGGSADGAELDALGRPGAAMELPASDHSQPAEYAAPQKSSEAERVDVWSETTHEIEVATECSMRMAADRMMRGEEGLRIEAEIGVSSGMYWSLEVLGAQ